MSANLIYRMMEDLVKEGKAKRIYKDNILEYELTKEGIESERESLKLGLQALAKAFDGIDLEGKVEVDPELKIRLKNLHAILNDKS